MNSSHDPSPAPKQVWTIESVLRWVVDDFRARGLESPRLEAELLLSYSLGCNRIQLILDRDRPLSTDELNRFRALVVRRRKHEPVAYLRGEREFFGHLFRVDSRVLIPRPDTETLVEVALERTLNQSLYGTMVDLCTGSGCVAIAFAKERPTWKVQATDLSPDALAVARQNAERLGVVWNTSFWQGNLFEAVQGQGPYHLITANPPYIPSPEMQELAPDIREHEPTLALDGGPDGLDLVRILVVQAPQHLLAGGVLALEVAFDQTEKTEALLTQAGFSAVRTNKDLGGRPRVVSGEWCPERDSGA